MLGSLALGAAVSLLAIEPIEILVFASVVGGLCTPVLLVLLLLLARSRRIMGEHRVAGRLALVGWASILVVSAASLVYLAQEVHQWLISGM
jgi:Mn2+/Fe2+ NRAMP family transporter